MDEGRGGYGGRDYGGSRRFGREDERSWRGGYGERDRGYGDRDRDYGERSGGHGGGARDEEPRPGSGYIGRAAFGRDSSAYGHDEYRGYRRDDYGDDDRGFLERAGDEVASWFGGHDAERRRTGAGEDERHHRGRGPKGYRRSDERIREDVSDRLSDDRHIDASDIEVTVSGGEVTLSGTVASRFEKRHAEDLAERVSGVTHVQNNLRVAQRGGMQTGGAMGGSTSGTSSGLTGSGVAGGSADTAMGGSEIGGGFRRDQT